MRLEDGSSSLVKDNWVDISRDEKEADTLNSLKDIPHNKHVPKVRSHEVVQFRGEDDTTERIREPLMNKVVKDGKETWEWKDAKYKKCEQRRHERMMLTSVRYEDRTFPIPRGAVEWH